MAATQLELSRRCSAFGTSTSSAAALRSAGRCKLATARLYKLAAEPSHVCHARTVDVEAARTLLNGPTMVVDIRPAREFEDSRITKPPRKSVSSPYTPGSDSASLVSAVGAKVMSKATPIIVMCADGGAASAEAAELLEAAGYADVAQVAGGYRAYCQVWSPSGKRKPPAGRWVSTGKESLKSGLNIAGVADSYDEGGNGTVARSAKGMDPGQMESWLTTGVKPARSWRDQ